MEQPRYALPTPSCPRSGMAVKWLARVGVLILSLLLSASGEARPPDKTARIGLLDYGAPNPSSDARWNAFRVRLRELGYVEGRNVAFEVRCASGRVDRLSGLAEELIESKVDVVVTVTTDVAVAVRRITSSVPIVTATGGDPVAAGL